jgi:hypothetical protein
LRVHTALEESEGTTPVSLGAIKRKVSVPDQLIRGRAVSRANGNANAGASNDVMAVDLVVLAHHVEDAVGKYVNVSRLRNSDLQDGEFIATHPGNRVGIPNQRLQSIRHHLQELVPDRMAQSIVHGLEVIEVEQVDG